MSKKIYQSAYSGGKITDAQYLTEIMCETIAKNQNKDLPRAFWLLPEWNKTYRQHISAANTILKLYDLEAILNALKDKSCGKVFSLRSPVLLKLIEKYQKDITLKKQQTKQITNIQDIINTPRPSISKKNILSRLK